VIKNDDELTVTTTRIVYFVNLLKGIRIASRVTEYPSVSGGYLAEVQKMHQEVIDYLSRHASETTAKTG